MSYYDAMREVMDNAIEHDICNLYFYHVMMGLINKAESEHKFLYDEFMNAKGDRIKAENEKLRELARELYDDLARGPEPPDWIDEYRLDMQELGIEVDDGDGI